jgi:hypothetical protein
MHSQQLVEAQGQLGLSDSYNFVDKTNERTDRILARVRQLHGNDLNAFFKSILPIGEAKDQRSDYLFYAPIFSADRR